MKNKSQPSKPAPKDAEVKPKWMTNLITCWSQVSKNHHFLTLENAVLEAREEWDFIDYVVSAETLAEDTTGIKAMMKKLGYYLIDTRGTFQHYTRKVKAAA